METATIEAMKWRWEGSTNSADRIGIPRRTLRSFDRLSLSIKPPYLGNTHGPADKVRNRHGAVADRFKRFGIWVTPVGE